MKRMGAAGGSGGGAAFVRVRKGRPALRPGDGGHGPSAHHGGGRGGGGGTGAGHRVHREAGRRPPGGEPAAPDPLRRGGVPQRRLPVHAGVERQLCVLRLCGPASPGGGGRPGGGGAGAGLLLPGRGAGAGGPGVAGPGRDRPGGHRGRRRDRGGQPPVHPPDGQRDGGGGDHPDGGGGVLQPAGAGVRLSARPAGGRPGGDGGQTALLEAGYGVLRDGRWRAIWTGRAPRGWSCSPARRRRIL